MNTDNRKGELAEIRAQLRHFAGSRLPGANEAKRDLLKKVISLMTVGIDVSELFIDMMLCTSNTCDLVLKKMCYLYLANYAVVNPEVAVMTINFLLKDCKDEDPMVRGLALRSLSSLRVKNLVEYVVGPIKEGLQDENPYVRSVAVMGVLKVYHIAPAACAENDLSSILLELLWKDCNGQVVANSLYALLELYAQDVQGLNNVLCSRASVFSLLNRMKAFSEWSQCVVLDLVSKYEPIDASETFDIMNLLEDRLQHANSAVVLATARVFLRLSSTMEDVHQQVYGRIKAPLLTLISTGSPEVSFSVLCHLRLLVLRAPVLFALDYKHLFCRHSDPLCSKKLKLEMLTAVANKENTYDIVTELSECAANVNIAIARQSIRAVGQIALHCYDVNGVVDRLLQFLEMEIPYITAETLVLVKDLLRKYPQWSQDCIAVIGSETCRRVQEPKAKVALVWMLGEYGEDMPDAPYLLEDFVHCWIGESQPEVKLELLTSTGKLFFKRPAECHLVLGTALAFGLGDHNQDVRDKALSYYRMLQEGATFAEGVINPPKHNLVSFVEGGRSELKDRVFEEFNSLAAIYGKPSFMFLDKGCREKPCATEALQSPYGGRTASPASSHSMQETVVNDTLLLLSLDDNPKSRVDTAEPSPEAVDMASEATRGMADNRSMDVKTHSMGVPSEEVHAVHLNARPLLEAKEFESKWTFFTTEKEIATELSVETIAAVSLPATFIRHLASHGMQCMASGGGREKMRFFFFAQLEGGRASTDGYFLVELVISMLTRKAVIKGKAEVQDRLSEFLEYFKDILHSYTI